MFLTGLKRFAITTNVAGKTRRLADRVRYEPPSVIACGLDRRPPLQDLMSSRSRARIAGPKGPRVPCWWKGALTKIECPFTNCGRRSSLKY